MYECGMAPDAKKVQGREKRTEFESGNCVMKFQFTADRECT